MIRITVTAIHRNISTMKFGIARNHFTSGSHRFRSQSPFLSLIGAGRTTIGSRSRETPIEGFQRSSEMSGALSYENTPWFVGGVFSEGADHVVSGPSDRPPTG